MRQLTRSAPVRIVLAATLAALTLSACGQSDGDGADSASEPTSSAPASEESAPEPGDSASATGGEGATSTGGGAVLVAGDIASTTTTRIISASNADGQVSARPVPLEDEAALDDFVAGFGSDLGPQVRAAVREADVPEGQTLMGAVAAVGCDKPTGIELAQTFDGWEVTGIVPKSGKQCIVAATSVALFLVETT